MKKLVSAALALVLLFGCLLPAVSARELGQVRVRFNSDIAGCGEAQYARIFEILSDNVTYGFSHGPMGISDYIGRPLEGGMEAGRTYDIYCLLDAADGFELPESLPDGAVTVDCGKGVTVNHVSIVYAKYRMDDGSFETYRGIQIRASVVVDGSFMQRVVGWLKDTILKIRYWQPY